MTYAHKLRRFDFDGMSQYACENCDVTTLDGGAEWNSACCLSNLTGMTYIDSNGVIYGGESGDVVLCVPCR